MCRPLGWLPTGWVGGWKAAPFFIRPTSGGWNVHRPNSESVAAYSINLSPQMRGDRRLKSLRSAEVQPPGNFLGGREKKFSKFCWTDRPSLKPNYCNQSTRDALWRAFLINGKQSDERLTTLCVRTWAGVWSRKPLKIVWVNNQFFF